MKQKKSQLSYDDVSPCREEVSSKWRNLFGKIKSQSQSEGTEDNMSTANLWKLVKEGK